MTEGLEDSNSSQRDLFLLLTAAKTMYLAEMGELEGQRREKKVAATKLASQKDLWIVA